MTVASSVSRLDHFKEFYARLVTAAAGVPDATRLVAALASVPREQFIGPGPWRVMTPTGYITTPNDDPALLYQDIVVSLAGEGPINNGQPSLHAACLAALDPVIGETAIHIGAGTGYYTAILAHLVGAQGRVTAYEVEPPMAARATRNLAPLPNVTVQGRSGSDIQLPRCDLIYVSAGATRPLDTWLDALKVGGRLLFPLTPAEGIGGMLLATRQTTHHFRARFVSPAMFIPCVGARDDATAHGLSEVFRTKDTADVRMLYRDEPPDDTAWFSGEGWWLSTASAR
jgi:protein-L-isoaspartate(D-aspartate) O-methyltransferase